MDSITELIKNLEMKLLHADMRSNPALIDELIDTSFEEINSSGQINTRQQVIQWLVNKESNQNWMLKDFRVKSLTDHTVIAIYRAINSNQTSNQQGGSIRSSVWQHQDNRWKMIFHQATKQI